MRRFGIVLFFVTIVTVAKSQEWQIQEKKEMLVKVANNAVTEAIVNGNVYVYSFGGIDSTKIYTGINNRSYKYDVASDNWDTLPSIPDVDAKIAAAASFVNGKIYIIGGYKVFANGSETSSNKVHRFDPVGDTFLTDGATIPRVIDDHVQAVYKDSLIFVVTGWSNTRNVPFVQIYDTYQDTWSNGTRLPNNSAYQVFGSTGTIIGDTLYYFGGALGGTNFPTSNHLRKGYIDPMDPTIISWEVSIPAPTVKAYRPACTSVNNTVYWIGGSEVSYNYDGIAYDGSGGVVLANQIVSYSPSMDSLSVYNPTNDTLPMDLRGVASINDSVKYIVGGMWMNQEVSNRVFRLEYRLVSGINENQNRDLIQIFPNPFSEEVILKLTKNESLNFSIYKSKGELMLKREKVKGTEIRINTASWPTGIYYLNYGNNNFQENKKMIHIR